MSRDGGDRTRLSILLFTDIVGSTDLKSKLGTARYRPLLARHNQIFETLIKQFNESEILKHTGDGYFSAFAKASDAVRFALLLQSAMRRENWQPEKLPTRVGLHAGEVAMMTMAGRKDVIGLAADLAARVMSIAQGGQILLTRGVFDDARQFVDEHPDDGSGDVPKVRWVAHGAYLFKGSDQPTEVYEVGAENLAPLRPPPDAEKARRVTPEPQRKQLGWRPAVGQTVPNRADWRLVKRSRADTGEETWVGSHKATGERRRFRFLFDDAKTRTVKEVLTVAPAQDDPGVLDSQLDQSPAFIATPDRPAAEDVPADPDWVGPYQIIQRLGEGGMGVVYRAEQRDPIRREVAIKLIKLGMDSREVLARFEAERQALALMNHPGIARVLDAGISDAGRPYFVMEYVAGEKLTDYCDRHQLSTHQRLALFRQVCDAVQHAHSKGIIHRDIKPSNILVSIRDEKPVPVIIDFGVAKATNQRLTEHSVFTERGQLIGTPEYMSPEQAEMTAVDIDTRSDIYSLGVVLYELLIGALPFDPTTLRSAAYAEIQRIIREVDPPRPSTRLSSLGSEKAAEIARRRRAVAAALEKEMRGELEWIPLRAMRKDRTERYRTAAELGDDVRNYLAARPLIAGPESVPYRLRKFVRRNRGRVIGTSSGAAAVLLTILISLVVVTHQRNEARRVRAEAERNYRVARQAVLDFFISVSQSELLRYQRLAPLRRELLQRAADYFSVFAAEHAADANRRADLAQALNVLGDAQTQLGSADAGRATLLRSIEIRRALAAEAPADIQRQIDLAATIFNVANVDYSESNFAAATAGYNEAVQTLQPAHDKGIQEATSQLAQAHHNLAVTSDAQADRPAAGEQFLKAILLRRSLYKGQPASSRYAAELAASLTALGKLTELDRPADAVAPVREAIELRRRVWAANPDATPQLRALADTTAWLAQLEFRLNDPAATETNRSAIELWKILSTDPRHFGQRAADAAEAYTYLSWLHLLNRDFVAAEAAARRGLALRDGDGCLTINLAHALLLAGHTDDAVGVYGQCRGRSIEGVALDEYLRADFASLAGSGLTAELAELVLTRLR